LGLNAQTSLSLADVQQKVKDSNLDLKAQQVQEDIAESHIKQAKKFPNPELEVELENLGKNEIVVGISQPFELGGKRGIRVETAKLEAEISNLELKQLKLELETETNRKILPLLAVDREIELLDNFIAAARKTLAIMEERIEIGAAMILDKLRAEVELEELLLEHSASEAERFQLKKELAALWTGSPEDFNKIDVRVINDLQLPDLTEFYIALENHTETKIQNLERAIAKQELKDAKASAIPDLGIGAGIVRNNEEKENAFVLSAGLELPIFNRYKDEIKAVKLSRKVLDFEIDSAQLDRKAEINTLYSEFTVLTNELYVLKTKILPNLLTINQSINSYYEKGSVSFLEVLEAKSELLETKSRLMELYNTQAEICNELYELSGYKIEFFQNL